MPVTGLVAGMGGAYLTLLNTIANMGVILPKTPLFAAMDWLTFSQCHDKGGLLVHGLSCPKKIRLLTGSSTCTDAGEVQQPGSLSLDRRLLWRRYLWACAFAK